MTVRNSIIRLIKSTKELGIKKSAFFAVFQAARRSGYYRTHSSGQTLVLPTFQAPVWIYSLFATHQAISNQLTEIQKIEIRQKAGMILTEQFLAFEASPQPIEFGHSSAHLHWSNLSDNFTNGEDIKLSWEAARFSWVFPLIQADILENNPVYFNTFKNLFHSFSQQNPQGMGIHWMSAQEVALRICAYAGFSHAQEWDASFELELRTSIWQHAQRIPSTLLYARAQNNNHLLSETLGLYYAGNFFAETKSGQKWLQMGWRIFNKTLQSQIASNGTYIQQSMNYHRMMLTEALWFYKLASLTGKSLPPVTLEKLQAATHWLDQFVQPESGKTPNLGHNDGSLIFPLSTAPYDDYRPILNACQHCFMPQPYLLNLDYTCWLSLPETNQTKSAGFIQPIASLPILRSGNLQAYLRAETFNDRPAHADQNHLDLWFHGENIAMDAGTYRYTDLPPWNNGLAHTLNHNTLTLNDMDQMTWASRFLWLDWSKGQYLNHGPNLVSAQNDGYKKLGVRHARQVTPEGQDECCVEDRIEAIKKNTNIQHCTLHWLLPEGEWKIVHNQFELQKEDILVHLSLLWQNAGQMENASFNVFRCGELLHGSTKRSFPTLGWVSPTYNIKIPAISVVAEFENPVLPFCVQSNWKGFKTLIPQDLG
jgi:hypothetical protein